MRHKHADLIHAWAEGAEIEVYDSTEGKWYIHHAPAWEENYKYRISGAPIGDGWWNNIPEHGIICRDKYDDVRILYIKPKHPQIYTPLTNEELERFKR